MISPTTASPGRRAIQRVRRQILHAAIAACGLLGLHPLAPPARAQTAQQIGEQARQIERIQQEQQERQRQQWLEDSRQRKASPPLALPEAPPPSAPGEGACRDIKEIVLSGVTLLPAALQTQLIAPYLDRCLSVADIERLLGDIVKAYIDRGYIAVRPYLRAQDLSAGRLEILIVEGKVESILLDDGGKQSVDLATAFPGVRGEALNLRDIEQGLDQINRLASNNATMEVLPGNDPGDSVVRISNDPGFPFAASLTGDNLGSSTTGKNELGTTLSADHPLGINDFLSVSYRESVGSERGQRNSVMGSAYYAVPFGYGLLSLSRTYSSYTTPLVLASGTTLESTGDSTSTMARVDWVGYRDRVQKLIESIAVTQKTSHNYLADQLLEVSSRKLSILDLDLLWNRRVADAALSVGVGYSKGLDAFGALEDKPGIADAYPHAQGDKLRYSASLFMPFVVVGVDASFSSQLSGQHAFTALYGTEQMLLGSYYTVRGFRDNSLSGDRAFYVRNEVALTVPNFLSSGLTAKPYLGLDAGRIAAFANTPAASLVGGAVGVRLSGRQLSGDLVVTKALHAPQAMDREAAQLLASVTISF